MSYSESSTGNKRSDREHCRQSSLLAEPASKQRSSIVSVCSLAQLLPPARKYLLRTYLRCVQVIRHLSASVSQRRLVGATAATLMRVRFICHFGRCSSQQYCRSILCRLMLLPNAVSRFLVSRFCFSVLLPNPVLKTCTGQTSTISFRRDSHDPVVKTQFCQGSHNPGKTRTHILKTENDLREEKSNGSVSSNKHNRTTP